MQHGILQRLLRARGSLARSTKPETRSNPALFDSQILRQFPGRSSRILYTQIHESFRTLAATFYEYIMCITRKIFKSHWHRYEIRLHDDVDRIWNWKNLTRTNLKIHIETMEYLAQACILQKWNEYLNNQLFVILMNLDI